MKFEEIFDKAGWYVAKSFDEGVVIFIEHGVHDTEMKVMCFDNAQAIAPLELKIPVYRGLFKKELGLKMTELQFFNLCEECGIVIRRSVVYFHQFEEANNEH